MKRLGLFAFAVAMQLSANVAHADMIGFAEKIYDGDTFALCDQTVCNKIRICGIDAPEIGDKGSSQATAALAGLRRGGGLCSAYRWAKARSATVDQDRPIETGLLPNALSAQKTLPAS